MPEQDDKILAEVWYYLYPEFRFFESSEGVNEVEQEIRRHLFRSWRIWVGVGLLTGSSIWLSLILGEWLRSTGLASWAIGMVSALFWVAVGAIITLLCIRRPSIKVMRHYLQEHGVAVCLKCGYDLRGQSQPRCPECGIDFDPGLIDAGTPGVRI